MLIFYDIKLLDWNITINPNTDFVSAGFVAEDGSDLYIVNSGFNWDCSTSFLKNKVKPKLLTTKLTVNSSYEFVNKDFKRIIEDWISAKNTTVELVSAHYKPHDYLFLPSYPTNLEQWLKDLGSPKLPDQYQDWDYNALHDARIIKNIYLWLKDTYSHPAWTQGLVAVLKNPKPE